MYRILSLLLAFGMLCSVAHLAEAGTVTLGWDPNTEADLAGYKLYYGNSPGVPQSYTHTVPINNRSATSWELSLSAGIYYFALTALDSAGNESGFSNEVRADISDAPATLGKPGTPILIQ